MTIVMAEGLAGPRSPPASPASTSQPLRGPGRRRGPPAHSLSSQGGRGRPDTRTHTHSAQQGQAGAGPASGSPAAPLRQTSAPTTGTWPPTRPHNTTLFLVLKLLPLGGPPCPFPLLSPGARIKRQSSHPPARHHPSPLHPPPLHLTSRRHRRLALGTWDTSR